MIFISYNHKDELLVDMVARRLELEFGRNNIFYDKWSIHPGDSIIGKMNEGLDAFTTFFFFLSPNSLTSKMVAKEWQSALALAINNSLKFVPVRIADCNPPAILTDTLYIDLYGIGLDDAVAQMKCVIRGKSTYTPLEEVSNLYAIVEKKSQHEIKLEIHARMYSENNNHFAFLLNNDVADFSAEPQGVPMHYSANGKYTNLIDGKVVSLSMKSIQLYHPLTPQMPTKIIIKSSRAELDFYGIMQVISATEGKAIPITSGKVNW